MTPEKSIEIVQIIKIAVKLQQVINHSNRVQYFWVKVPKFYQSEARKHCFPASDWLKIPRTQCNHYLGILPGLFAADGPFGLSRNLIIIISCAVVVLAVAVVVTAAMKHSERRKREREAENADENSEDLLGHGRVIFYIAALHMIFSLIEFLSFSKYSDS